MKSVRIECLREFEFYDGPVAGTVGCAETRYVFCLVSFDPARDARRFVYLPISAEEGAQIETIFDREAFGSVTFNEHWVALLTSRDEVLWTDQEPGENETVFLSEIGRENWPRLQRYALPCIDEAVSDEATEFWESATPQAGRGLAPW